MFQNLPEGHVIYFTESISGRYGKVVTQGIKESFQIDSG